MVGEGCALQEDLNPELVDRWSVVAVWADWRLSWQWHSHWCLEPLLGGWSGGSGRQSVTAQFSWLQEPPRPLWLRDPPAAGQGGCRSHPARPLPFAPTTNHTALATPTATALPWPCRAISEWPAWLLAAGGDSEVAQWPRPAVVPGRLWPLWLRAAGGEAEAGGQAATAAAAAAHSKPEAARWPWQWRQWRQAVSGQCDC